MSCAVLGFHAQFVEDFLGGGVLGGDVRSRRKSRDNDEGREHREDSEHYAASHGRHDGRLPEGLALTGRGEVDRSGTKDPFLLVVQTAHRLRDLLGRDGTFATGDP